MRSAWIWKWKRSPSESAHGALAPPGHRTDGAGDPRFNRLARDARPCRAPVVADSEGPRDHESHENGSDDAVSGARRSGGRRRRVNRCRALCPRSRGKSRSCLRDFRVRKQNRTWPQPLRAVTVPRKCVPTEATSWPGIADCGSDCRPTNPARSLHRSTAQTPRPRSAGSACRARRSAACRARCSGRSASCGPCPAGAASSRAGRAATPAAARPGSRTRRSPR